MRPMGLNLGGGGGVITQAVDDWKCYLLNYKSFLFPDFCSTPTEQSAHGSFGRPVIVCDQSWCW